MNPTETKAKLLLLQKYIEDHPSVFLLAEQDIGLSMLDVIKLAVLGAHTHILTDALDDLEVGDDDASRPYAIAIRDFKWETR